MNRKLTELLSTLCLLVSTGIILSTGGCARQTDVDVLDADPTPLPTYESIVLRYNERTDRLTRLWSRAVVQVRYENESGHQKRIQGEGHLQLVQPDKLALSVGKLGEVLFWLGANEERFWIFELGEQDRASVCRHENVGNPCAQTMSVPVHPLAFVMLLGITSLTLEDRGTVSRNVGNDEIVLDIPLEQGSQRLVLDPVLLVPRRVELYDDSGELAAWSELTEYQRIAMEGSPGFNPQVASRIVIQSADARASVRVFLSDTSDGKAIGRIPDAVFDFETLVRAHRPASIHVLDERCDTPAMVIEHNPEPGT